MVIILVTIITLIKYKLFHMQSAEYKLFYDTSWYYTNLNVIQLMYPPVDSNLIRPHPDDQLNQYIDKVVS